MAASHASGPCQNHRGSALMAAAIIRLTSPETVDCVEEPGGRRLTEVAPDPSWEDA